MNFLLYIIYIVVLITPSYPTVPGTLVCQGFGDMPKGAVEPHTGIDFKVPVGTNVYADVDGRVIEEHNNDRTYGRFIMILHPDGNASLYAHLSAFKVEVGDYVRGGDLVALSGGNPDDNIEGDGVSSGAHLHWEVRAKGHIHNYKYNVDPIEYLQLFYDTSYYYCLPINIENKYYIRT